MTRFRTSTALLALPLGLGALLSGCAVEEGNAGGGSTQAKASGNVVIACTPQEEQCQAMAAAFTKSTGIKASYVRMSSGEGVARLDAAKSKPEFDVLYGGPSDGHVAAAQAGLTEKYVSPNASKIPEKYKAADGTWTGTYVGALGFCSNEDVLKKLGMEAPTSWADLLDPKLKKNVAIAHPSTSGTSYTAVWTQMVLNGMDEEKTFDFLGKLHNNVLQYSKSGAAPGQMAGRGEVAVGVIFSHDCVKYQKEGFDMLKSTFPSEGTGYEVGAVSLVKGGPERRQRQEVPRLDAHRGAPEHRAHGRQLPDPDQPRGQRHRRHGQARRGEARGVRPRGRGREEEGDHGAVRRQGRPAAQGMTVG